MDTLLNPTVVVEVLSPSTEAYDRGDKFGHYRKMDSLHEYLLVSEDKPHIERYTRQDNTWGLTEAEGMEVFIDIDSIGCTLSLNEMYDKIFMGDGLAVTADRLNSWRLARKSYVPKRNRANFISKTVRHGDLEVRVYLYGSRVDDQAKYGDIDLLVRTHLSLLQSIHE